MGCIKKNFGKKRKATSFEYLKETRSNLLLWKQFGQVVDLK